MASGQVKQAQPSLLQDVIKLLLKIVCILLAFVLVFSFIFGAYRYNDLSMTPAVKDGDLVITYRWDKRFLNNDLCVFWYNDDLIISRVIAREGDEVDIRANGLYVNGNKIVEDAIKMETTQVKDAVQFPLTVPKGFVFALGDNRDEAVDSRIIGCIDVNKTEGKVIGLFRHRGF